MKKDKKISGKREENGDDVLLLDIFKAAFSIEDIEIESAVFQRWRIVDDSIFAHPILTVRDLFREFGEGNYHLAITRAIISGIEKQPFTMYGIDIEISYQNNQWSEPRVYTDWEEFGPEHTTPQALHARLENIKENIKAILDLLAVIARIGGSLHDLL